MINNDLKADIIIKVLRPRLLEELKEHYGMFTPWRQSHGMSNVLANRIINSQNSKELNRVTWEKIFSLCDHVGLPIKLSIMDMGLPTIDVIKLCEQELGEHLV